MGLTKIHAEGFRSLRSVDLELGPVTVLIGANGSGKSNLLTLLQMVPLMRTQSLQRFVEERGRASSFLHYGPTVSSQMSVSLDFEERSRTRYSATLGYTAQDTFVFLREACETLGAGTASSSAVELGSGHRESRLEGSASPCVQEVREAIARMSFFHFHDTSLTSLLRAPSRAEDARYLRSNGSNLASYLLALRTSATSSDKAAYERIHHLLRQVAPFVKELAPTLLGRSGMPAEAVHESGDVAGLKVRLDWIDERDGIFGPHQLSDGTLRALALVTALSQPHDRLPGFLSIDEPELGLHPSALHLLVELVRSISHRSQVLLATQSPALLDHFEPEEVVVAELEQGGSCFRRLDRKELQAWLQEYSLSEIYDKNIIGGRP